MKYYVYCLIDVRSNIIFYIGKGTGNRMYYHENYIIKKDTHQNKRLYKQIKSMLDDNVSVEYRKLFITDDEAEAYLAETGFRNMHLTSWLCNGRDNGWKAHGRSYYDFWFEKYGKEEADRLEAQRVARHYFTTKGKKVSEKAAINIKAAMNRQEVKAINSLNNRGEKNPAAKLADVQVIEIRKLFLLTGQVASERFSNQMAIKYNVSSQSVYRAIKHKSFKHIK